MFTLPVSVTYIIWPMELWEHSTKQTIMSMGLKSNFLLNSREYTLTSSSALRQCISSMWECIVLCIVRIVKECVCAKAIFKHGGVFVVF